MYHSVSPRHVQRQFLHILFDNLEDTSPDTLNYWLILFAKNLDSSDRLFGAKQGELIQDVIKCGAKYVISLAILKHKFLTKSGFLYVQSNMIWCGLIRTEIC